MTSNPSAASNSLAMSESIEEHRKKLRALIGQKIQDQIEAEDILQDVFEEYVEAMDIGEIIETLGAWLTRVAQNKIIDRFRRTKTQKNYLLENSSTDGTANNPTPEDELMQSFLRGEIIAALDALPENQRSVFIQHEIEGKSFEDISQETGVSINTLLARKRYAIQFLREHLKEIYNEI